MDEKQLSDFNGIKEGFFRLQNDILALKAELATLKTSNFGLQQILARITALENRLDAGEKINLAQTNLVNALSKQIQELQKPKETPKLPPNTPDGKGWFDWLKK